MKITRRAALGGLLATTATGVAAPLRAAVPSTGTFSTLRVFGDSFSITTWPFETWSRQLLPTVPFRYVRVWAKSGATAADSTGRVTFAQQITSWSGSSDRVRADDVTVVYFGYNDIDMGIDLARSRAGLKAGLDRLIAAGMTANGGQILLVLGHDWGANPAKRAAGTSATMRARTLAWHDHIRTEMVGRSRVFVVDLFDLFDPILASPASFGLTNVTTADAANAATTALYYDTNHLGGRGQGMIAAAIRARLIAP